MRRAAAVLVAAFLVIACSGDGEDAAPSTSAASSTSTTEGTTSTTAEPGTTTSTTVDTTDEPDYLATVSALADDAMEGRDNGSVGSVLAQDYLMQQLEPIAEPLGPEYRQPFAQGTNIIGVIRGATAPDEYVVLGAHYDHLGHDCSSTADGDDICNGASDNAAGVAAVLEVGRAIAAGPPPDRSVVLAFWDAEEDGLFGSSAYVAAPTVPLASTVAYVNWDGLGLDLLPSLGDVTIAVGAETGGPALVDAVAAATGASDLAVTSLSLLFGQGRSDHAVFAAAGVPTVFFTDATDGCYHTAQDDLDHLDIDKLGREILLGTALVRSIASGGVTPTFVADTPVASYADAISMSSILNASEPDRGLFPGEAQARVAEFDGDLEAIVAAGPDAFDEAAVGTLLTGSADVVDILDDGECT